MMTGDPKTAQTVRGLLLGLCALMASVSANAEIYRFPGTFMIKLGTAIADKEFDGTGGVTYRWSNVDVANRLPTELAFVFGSEQDLRFPPVITSVFAVKPKNGGIENALMAPMVHQGGGEYRFRATAGHDVVAWFEAHGKELVAGNVVLQRIDGLFDRLAEMNPETTVAVSSRFMFAGNEIETRGPTRAPRITGRHRELRDAVQEGRDLPEWYLDEMGPEHRAFVTEMMNKRRAKLAQAKLAQE